MDLIELNKKIENVYKKIETLESVYNGDVFNVWTNNPSVKYASFVYEVKRMVVGENTTQFTYVFYIGDRLINDNTNYNMIYENSYKTLEYGLAQLQRENGILSINVDRNYNFVNQKFADVLSVVYGEVTFEVRNETDLC